MAPNIKTSWHDQKGLDCLTTSTWSDAQVAECLTAKKTLLNSPEERAMAAHRPEAEEFMHDFLKSLEAILSPTVGIRYRTEYLFAAYSKRAGAESSCHQYLHRGREEFAALRAELSKVADESVRISLRRSTSEVDLLKMLVDQTSADPFTRSEVEGRLEGRRMIFFRDRITAIHSGWHGYDDMVKRGERLPPVGFRTLEQKMRAIFDDDDRCVWTGESSEITR